MAYGRTRRTYRSRRRPRRNFASCLRSRVKSRRRKTKRKVRPYAASLQSSTYVPKSRIVTISDDRTYHCHDNGYVAGTTVRCPLMKKFNLNDPRVFWDDEHQGEWIQTDYGQRPAVGTQKDQGIPGLEAWVTDAAANGIGAYRYCEAIKCKLIVSIYPITHQPIGMTSTSLPMALPPVQAVSKMIMRKVTAKGDIPWHQPPSTSFNADSESRKPFTLSGNLYSNVSGIAKGCTQTMYYSFKSLNRGTARSSMNHCYTDQEPTEKDHAYLTILPTHTNWNAGNPLVDLAAGEIPPNMCGRFRVHIKALVTLKLSEPNTAIYAGEGHAQANTQVQQFE